MQDLTTVAGLMNVRARSLSFPHTSDSREQGGEGTTADWSILRGYVTSSTDVADSAEGNKLPRNVTGKTSLC